MIVLPHSNWWWYHDIGFPLLDAEHSLCTAPWSGTSCRATSAHSRTMSPLDTAWKPGFSPDTSVFSTLETFEVIALYKSTFTIPFAIPYHCVFHFPNENEMENNTRFSSVQFRSIEFKRAQLLYKHYINHNRTLFPSTSRSLSTFYQRKESV